MCVCACVCPEWSWRQPLQATVNVAAILGGRLAIAVKGLLISTCYWPLSAGPLHNNGTGTTVECKVIDVALYLALLPTGAPRGSGPPSLPLLLPSIKKADQGFLRSPMLTACQSAQKTIWQCRINTVSWLINQIATRRGRPEFIYATWMNPTSCRPCGFETINLRIVTFVVAGDTGSSQHAFFPFG